MAKEQQKTIRSTTGLFELNLNEIWRYRDLLFMYVKRDVVTVYKQTILGPLWFIIQPLLTTLMFMFVFGSIAGISTDGIPQPVFYFSGIIIWNYFASCLTRNSQIFIENKDVFGKVYFPRLVVPLSVVISNLIRFFIQFFIFIFIYLYYYLKADAIFEPNVFMLLVPVLIIMTALLSLGFGIIFSSLTTKYRDLSFLLQFWVQLWMYITPVIYPLSSIPADKQWMVQLNPMSPIVESFKYALLNTGVFSWGYLFYSLGFIFVLLIVGILIFNKIEKNFMDTI